MNKDCLPGPEFRHVHQRLPGGQRAHRDRCGFYKVERFWFRSHFPFLDRDVIRPTAAKRWVAIDRVAHFELPNVRADFLDDTSDVVSRNQRQMGAEFLRVFPVERQWISWIDAAGDHTHERFIIVRLWPR